MNLPFFIARRIALSRGRNFSRIIIRIATVAVALSVGVMVASTALISGFKFEISRKIFEFWGHIHISNQAYSLSFEPVPIDRRQPFLSILDTLGPIQYQEHSSDLYWENGFSGKATSKKTLGGIRHIQAYAHKPGIIHAKNAIEGILLKGVADDFDWTNLKPYLQEGRPLALTDSAPSRDILISRQTADRLNVGVGDRFIVHFVKDRVQLRRMFEVCGIYKTGLEEYDRKFALCDLRQVQNLLGWDSTQISGFEIWVDQLRDIDLFNEFIYQELLPNDLLSVTIREKFPAIFEWLELQDYNEVVISALMLAVAIINMVTALMVLVLERSTMIGVLKALGAPDSKIRSIFLYHAAFITANGIFWGNTLGLGFCWLQDRFKFIRLNEADYYLAYAPVKIEWWTVLAINAGTLALILIFLVLPSLIVAKVTPVRAIRFK